MIKPILYIDIDDVILDTLTLWIQKLNYLYGTDVKYEDITDWDIRKFFLGLSFEQICFPLTVPDFWKEVKGKPNSNHALSLLSYKYEIYLVTATDYRNVRYKYEYAIKRLFPWIDWEHIIICQNKSLLFGYAIIDDNPNNLRSHYIVNKFLFNAPHNLNSNEFKRVYNFEEIIKELL